MTENRSLFSRARDAVTGMFKAKPVPAPDLGQHNLSQPYYPSRYTWGRLPTRTDYRREVGDLDLNSLAMAVVNFTANRIPEAKPAVARKSKQSEINLDYEHPAAKLIRRPNKHHIWANYAASCSMGWWFSGNVYFYESRDLTGTPVELWNLPHFLTGPRWPGDGGSPDVERWAAEHGEKNADLDPFLSHYQYTPPGKAPVLYPANDVIHLKRGIDLARPRLGLGAFESLYKELYGDDKMALFTASIMANMGLQVPIIGPKDDTVLMSQTAAEAIKEGWIRKTTGERAGEPVVLDMPLVVDKFGFNPSELDLSQLRLIPESRVCAVCQISPAALQVMVGIQNGTSYASSEQARQQGYEEVIIPIQAVWAEEFTHQLLSEFEGSEGMEFVFDTSKVRVLEEDRDALVKRESEIFKSGGSTLDQYLTAVGKKPVGDPLGSVRMVPGLSSPMSPERLIEMAKQKPNETPLTAGTQPVPDLKLNAALAVKHAQGWQRLIDLYGEQKATEFYTHLGLNHLETKSIEWEGLKLSREPKEHEKLAVKGIATAQESSKEAIGKILLSLREELISDGLKGVKKLTPATYHELTLQASSDSRISLRDRLIKVHRQGRMLVAAELGKKEAVPDDEFDELDDLVDVTLSRVVNETQSRIIASAIEGFTLGLSGNDLQANILSTVNAGSVTYIDRASGGVGNRVIGIGRRDEMFRRSDDIGRYEYSALLDVNTCSPCAQLDGTTAQSMDDLPEVPLADCDGGSLCRCFIVAIAL